jgi:hypothetical protein
MKKILLKQKPSHLLELNLISVKTTPKIIEDLLESVRDFALRIEGISLVNANVSKNSIKIIAEILTFSEFLKKLNIS